MNLNHPKPLVSVIIPSYNCAHLLPETIASVQDQTYTHWELLIINDGSTDETDRLIPQYLNQHSDDRIQFISKPNGGVSNTRNFGAHLAQGEIIAFLDADDRWLPHNLESHIKQFAQHPALGISFGRVEFITDSGESTGKTTHCELDQIPTHHFLYTNPTVTTSNLVVRTALFKQLNGFDESINHSEDMDFLFRASQCKGSNHPSNQVQIAGIDRVLVQYRIQTTGLSSTLEKMEQGWDHLMTKAHRTNPKLVDRHYKPAQAAQLQYLARQTLRLNLPAPQGIDYIHRAFIAHWPSILLKPRSILMTITLYSKHLSAKYLNNSQISQPLTKYFT
jgi:glycosyltransferase involved in cell wall biosynthesis